ncbi:MAG: cellulose biosynthesis cyclic di-GMP-binding regulatory protein BcsB, partial [Devosia sp.]
MRTRLALLASLLLMATAQAQTAPFDMSPEAALLPPAATPAEAASTVAKPAAPDFLRYLVPEAAVRLAGETDQRAFQIYLTAAQAAAPATVQVGYLNALVVAPETSRLRMEINGTTVLATPIASSAATSTMTAAIPEGILQPGFNTVFIRADQRHRTDCNIGSSYELWTDIDPAQTFIAFTGERLGSLARLDDMAAAGFDNAGRTTIRLAIPERTGLEGGPLAADLIQAIAHNLRVSNPTVEYAAELSEASGGGVLNVLVATAAALPDSVGELKAEASRGPVAAFSQDAPNTLVLSPPDWNGTASAMESVRVVANQYPRYENALPPRADHAQPIPMLSGQNTVTLESLGVQAFSFNGRRYRTT